MTQVEFTNLQEAMVYVFAPTLYWLYAFVVAGGILSGLLIIWMAFMRWISRR